LKHSYLDNIKCLIEIINSYFSIVQEGDINASTFTPILQMIADESAKHGHLDILEYIVDYCMDKPNLMLDRDCILLTGSSYGHLSIVIYITKDNIDELDLNSALLFGTRNGDGRIITHLIKIGGVVTDEILKMSKIHEGTEIYDYLKYIMSKQ
jgi:hypothetical protein